MKWMDTYLSKEVFQATDSMVEPFGKKCSDLLKEKLATFILPGTFATSPIPFHAYWCPRSAIGCWCILVGVVFLSCNAILLYSS